MTKTTIKGDKVRHVSIMVQKANRHPARKYYLVGEYVNGNTFREPISQAVTKVLSDNGMATQG